MVDIQQRALCAPSNMMLCPAAAFCGALPGYLCQGYKSICLRQTFIQDLLIINGIRFVIVLQCEIMVFHHRVNAQ